jgi:mannose-6-phosphate isomerase-like protein (cupin superfamily)
MLSLTKKIQAMPEIVDFKKIAAITEVLYFNTIINAVNDHVVRLAVMTEPYQWHIHPNSDETFVGVDETVMIETPGETFELTPGASITIPQNMPHRTMPKGARSVNLTIEKAGMETVFVDP